MKGSMVLGTETAFLSFSGEMFSSTRAKYTDNMDSSGQNGTRSGQVETSAVMEEGGGGRGRAEYKAKYGYKEKSKHTESDGKQVCLSPTQSIFKIFNLLFHTECCFM